VHGLWFYDIWTCSAKVLEYWIISSLKIKLNHSWNFWRNWNVPLMLLERSWWARRQAKQVLDTTWWGVDNILPNNCGWSTHGWSESLNGKTLYLQHCSSLNMAIVAAAVTPRPLHRWV
jgi:hypothetical protein